MHFFVIVGGIVIIIYNNLDVAKINEEWLISQGYEYGWIMELNRVRLNRLKELAWSNDLSNIKLLIEARFFSKGKELHIFKTDGYKAVSTTCESTDKCFFEEHTLIPRFGKSIRWRHYTGEDTDGQVIIIASCLDATEL